MTGIQKIGVFIRTVVLVIGIVLNLVAFGLCVEDMIRKPGFASFGMAGIILAVCFPLLVQEYSNIRGEQLVVKKSGGFQVGFSGSQDVAKPDKQ